MRLVSKVVVLAVAACLIGACNEVTTPVTAEVSFTVGAWDPVQGSAQETLQGVRICELDVANCTLTDARGEATLMMPTLQETGYTMELEGYAPWLRPTIVEGSGSTLGSLMIPAQFISDQHARVNSPYPTRDTGTILIISEPPAGAGLTFELVAATAKAFYHEPNRDWSLDLSETTSLGAGGFTEVTPGEFQINIGGTAAGCVATLYAWPGDSEDTLRVPVRNGYVTQSNIVCPVPP